MSNICLFCFNFDEKTRNADKECNCIILNRFVSPISCCPGWKPCGKTVAELLGVEERAVSNPATGRQVGKSVTPVKKAISNVKSNVIETKDFDIDMIQHVNLYEHQIHARERFKDKNEIALFFEMGCGKTLTSMMIMCDKFKAGLIDSLLVVAPNDVHKQWFDDLCNDESTLSKAIAQENVNCDGQILGGRSGQKALYDFDYTNGKLHILCVNIDTFSTPHKWEPIVEWANAHKTAIIIDEATVIKNPTSKRSQRMLYEFNEVIRRNKTILASKKKNPIRVALTGTPVTNGPIDLWSIMEFIKPNYFGRNYYSFMNYYGMHTQLLVNDRPVNVLLTEKTWHGIKNCDDFMQAAAIFGCSEDTYLTIQHQDKYLGPYKHADELKDLLEPNAVFAKLVDCVDMPPCNYIVKEVSLSDAQKEAYNSMKNELLAEYDNYISTARNKLVVTLRLQQISSGFIMGHEESIEDDDINLGCIDDDYDITPDEVIWLGNTNPKLEQMMRDVDELDKPMLILTRFSAEAAKIYEMLKDKYDTCLITGWKVVGSIEGFKSGKHDIMVANTAKMSRGHNLQIAHSTIYYSNTFSMEHRQQSEFRTFRIGQKHPCSYIDYVSCDVDRVVLNALKFKKNLLDYIREKDIMEII